MQKMINALMKMGYRQMSPDVWGKPIGCTLITAELKTMLFTQWFKINDTNHIWTSNTLNDLTEAENITQIKHFENWECKLERGNSQNGFEFLTPEQVILEILG